jgi:outer membrane receptor protein involved in Fe transport
MKIRFFVLLNFIIAPSVFAENTAKQTKADTTKKNINEIVVTAQRMAQNPFLVPCAITNLKSETIRVNGSRTSPEALSNFAGVFVQKTNHGGGSAFIRGLTGNQTLILIDGIRLNNSTFRYGPNQYLNTIDLATVNNMEVLKGSGSVQYGSDALGGAINVISKKIDFVQTKPLFGASIGSKFISQNMEKTLRTDLNYASKRFTAMAGVSFKQFGDLIGGDTTGKQYPSGYHEKAFNVNFKYLLKNNATLSAGSRYLIQNDIPVFYKIILENFAINQTKKQSHALNFIKYEAKTKHALIEHYNITLSNQEAVEIKESQKNNNPNNITENNIVNTLGLSAEFHANIQKNWKASTGIDLYSDKIKSNKIDLNTQTQIAKEYRGLYPNNANYASQSVFSLHEFNLNKFIFQAGIRFNAFEIQLYDTTLGTVNIKPNAFVYNFGILYQLNKNQNIYAALNTGYRAPNIDDMGSLGIVDFRYELPTANLKPEQSINTELGYRYQSEKIKTELLVFYNQLNNLISRVKQPGQVINGYDVYAKKNSQFAFIRGAEFSIDYAIHKQFHFMHQISYTYGQNITLNEPMRRIPPINGNVALQWNRNSHYIHFVAQFAGKQSRLAAADKSDNRIDKNGTPAWQIYHLNFGKSFQHFDINAGVHNILNQDYRTHGSGINGMGRNIWAAIVVKL